MVARRGEWQDGVRQCVQLTQKLAVSARTAESERHEKGL